MQVTRDIFRQRHLSTRLRGVFAPVLTPFDSKFQPDVRLFITHCRWLVSQGAGLAIFGTNSEAASLSVDERIDMTEAILDAGIPASSLLPGTGACAIADAIALSRHAVEAGTAGTLMLPPFYFKGVSDEGLFAYYSEVIERVGDSRLRIYLYHIPQFTQIPITLSLIEKLRGRYPVVIAGAKDSSGDWENTKAMLDNFAADGFDVFPASETMLSKGLALGAAGCISATVNMNPAGIRALYEGWNSADGPRLQGKADAVRQAFQSMAMIPAMKCAAAAYSGIASWAMVRPPLTQLDAASKDKLLTSLSEIGFEMAGLPKV
jgi:4-hydroxy-tetrahydrodipicolinate synthase